MKRIIIAAVLPCLLFLPVACKKKESPAAPPAIPAPADTATFTTTATPTSTSSLSPTFTDTPTITLSPTRTFSPTDTSTPTETGTPTLTRTPTVTRTATPTWTLTATRTPTRTATPLPNPRISFSASLYRNNSGTEYAQARLMVDDLPVTTAGVTVHYGANHSALPYYRAVTSGTDIWSEYRLSSGFTYTPGQAYTVIANTAAGAVTGSVVPSGGISHDPDGLWSTWTVDGISDNVYVMITGNTTCSFPADQDPPVNIPTSCYPWSGTYSIGTSSMQTGFNMTSQDLYTSTVVIP